MKAKEILDKVLEETYILAGALEVQDIDMVLVTLERRNEWINKFIALNVNNADNDVMQLLEKFDAENQLCIDKMSEFRGAMALELNQVVIEKKKMKQNQKIHEQYSNPYVNNTVGTAFDLKK